MTSSASDVHRFTFDAGLYKAYFEERLSDLKASHYHLFRTLVEAGPNGLTDEEALRISNAKSRNHLHALIRDIRIVIGNTRAKPLLILENGRYVLDAAGVTNIHPLKKSTGKSAKRPGRADPPLTRILTNTAKLNSALIREHLLTGPSAMEVIHKHLALICKRLRDLHRFTLVVPPCAFSLGCLEALLRRLSLDARGPVSGLAGFRVLIHEEAVTDFLGIDIANESGASAYTIGAGTGDVSPFLLGKRTAFDYCRDLKRVYRLDTVHHDPEVIHFHPGIPGNDRDRIVHNVQVVERAVRGAAAPNSLVASRN